MRTLLAAALTLTSAALAAAQTPVAAGSLQVTTRDVGQVDAGKLKGEPWRLAWSPDGATLYLQTVERDRFGNAKEYHYTLPAAGGEATKVEAQPDWATRYWAWKSAPAAPGTAGLKIDVSTRRETVRATAAPTGGGLAGMGGDKSPGGGGGRGSGGGTGAGEAVGAAVQGQTAQIVTLRLKDDIVGEYVNTPVTPGLSFGWAPQGRAAIAFADREGRLAIMDQNGGKTQVTGTHDVVLPAWSGDGTRIAFLQKSGRRTYKLTMASLDAK